MAMYDTRVLEALQKIADDLGYIRKVLEKAEREKAIAEEVQMRMPRSGL